MQHTKFQVLMASGLAEEILNTFIIYGGHVGQKTLTFYIKKYTTSL